MSEQPLKIGIPIYANYAIIDVMAPLQVLGFVPEPTPEIYLIAETEDPVWSYPPTRVMPDCTFETCPELDILVVPGGADMGTTLKNEALLDFIVAQWKKVPYVLSVCVGDQLLAERGLLKGRVVTTHWAAMGSMGTHEGVTLEGGYPRYVVSLGAPNPDPEKNAPNLITTGGLSAGLDGSLALVAMLRGEQESRAIQLVLQYAPDPPYHSGDPSQAEPQTFTFAQKVTAGIGAGVGRNNQQMPTRIDDLAEQPEHPEPPWCFS